MSSPLHHAGQLVVRVPKSGSYRLFSLLFRDHTNATYRIERDAVKRAGVCPICEEPLGDRQVQAIHKHGFSREAIVHGIIAEQEEVSLTAVQKAYDAVHREKAIIAIGCQTCHKAYGSREGAGHRQIEERHFVKARDRSLRKGKLLPGKSTEAPLKVVPAIVGGARRFSKQGVLGLLQEEGRPVRLKEVFAAVEASGELSERDLGNDRWGPRWQHRIRAWLSQMGSQGMIESLGGGLWRVR